MSIINGTKRALPIRRGCVVPSSKKSTRFTGSPVLVPGFRCPSMHHPWDLHETSIHKYLIRITSTVAGGDTSGLEAKSQTLEFLLGRSKQYFSLPTHGGRTLLSNGHSQLQLDQPPEKPHDRFLLDPVMDLCWLGLRKVFPRCLSPGPPAQLPHPGHPLKGKALAANKDAKADGQG